MILICRFSETIPIAIGKFLAATSCSYLQQPSLSPYPHLPKSPSPKSQVPSPKSQVPSPKSQVPSPKSQVPSPKSHLPKSQVPSPKSQVPSPKSQVPSPKSQVPSPKSQVPSPKSQVPSPKSRRPGGRGRRGARWFPLVLHQQHGHHSFMLPHRVKRLPVVPHRRADRSCGSSTLGPHWLLVPAASVKTDLQQPRSEVSLYVNF